VVHLCGRGFPCPLGATVTLAKAITGLNDQLGREVDDDGTGCVASNDNASVKEESPTGLYHHEAC
jgi:hypothetical protein